MYINKEQRWVGGWEGGRVGGWEGGRVGGWVVEAKSFFDL